MAKVMKIISKVLSTALVAVVVILAVLLVGIRLIGYTPYTVLSGSMEPAYHVGSVIYVAEVEPEELKVGDPITFVLNEDLVVATHQVVEIDAEGRRFYTKGDANETADAAPVHFNNVIGVPQFSIPLLGYVANFIQNPPGTYIAISAGAVLLLLMFLPDLFAKDEGKEKKKESVTTESK